MPSPTPFMDRLYGWLFIEGVNLLKIFVVAALLVRLLHRMDARLIRRSRQEPHTLLHEQQIRTMTSVMNSLGTVVIVTLAGMMALREIGLDVRPILAGAGVIGLAAGFGAQNLVRDLINGVFILVENQYGIGDTIRIPGPGLQGTVELMTLRRTVLRDSEGAVHTIPNGEIRVISNLSREWSQVSLSIPVGTTQRLEPVLEALRAAGEELAADPQVQPLLLESPRILGLEKLGGLIPQAPMEILVQVRTQPGRQGEVARQWRAGIKAAFDRAAIPSADPQEVRVLGHSGGCTDLAGTK